MDDLRTALQTLTADQPQNGSRTVEVRGRIRRRSRQRALTVGALSVVAAAGAVALVVPGQGAGPESLPGREVEGDGVARSGVNWDPRGDRLDEAGEAVDAWSRGGTVRGLQVLYAGSPVDVVNGRPSTQRWYAWQATRDGVLRLVVALDPDGNGPQAPEVLADQPAGTDDRRAISVVVTESDDIGDQVVWPGKPGAVVRDTLFVLPRPGARSVTRLLDSEPELGTVGASYVHTDGSLGRESASVSTVPSSVSESSSPVVAGRTGCHARPHRACPARPPGRRCRRTRSRPR